MYTYMHACIIEAKSQGGLTQKTKIYIKKVVRNVRYSPCPETQSKIQGDMDGLWVRSVCLSTFNYDVCVSVFSPQPHTLLTIHYVFGYLWLTAYMCLFV